MTTRKPFASVVDVIASPRLVVCGGATGGRGRGRSSIVHPQSTTTASARARVIASSIQSRPVFDLVQESRAPDELAIVRGALHEHDILVESCGLDALGDAGLEADHRPGLVALEQIAAVLVHQDHFLVALHGLGLRELVEPATGLE